MSSFNNEYPAATAPELIKTTSYCSFNKDINYLPNSLVSLELGKSFNKSVDSLPDSIITLKLKIAYYNVINNLYQIYLLIDNLSNYLIIFQKKLLKSLFKNHL